MLRLWAKLNKVVFLWFWKNDWLTIPAGVELARTKLTFVSPSTIEIAHTTTVLPYHRTTTHPYSRYAREEKHTFRLMTISGTWLNDYEHTTKPLSRPFHIFAWHPSQMGNRLAPPNEEVGNMAEVSSPSLRTQPLRPARYRNSKVGRFCSSPVTNNLPFVNGRGASHEYTLSYAIREWHMPVGKRSPPPPGIYPIQLSGVTQGSFARSVNRQVTTSTFTTLHENSRETQL